MVEREGGNEGVGRRERRKGREKRKEGREGGKGREGGRNRVKLYKSTETTILWTHTCS